MDKCSHNSLLVLQAHDGCSSVLFTSLTNDGTEHKRLRKGFLY